MLTNTQHEIQRLCKSLAIVEDFEGRRGASSRTAEESEDTSDSASSPSAVRDNWGNATENDPAFVVYLGCARDRVHGHLKALKTFYRCYETEIRFPDYLTDFEVEIAIYGMQRESDAYALGLDDLLISQILHDCFPLP